MKMMLLASLMLLGTQAGAEIRNSQYDSRHQQAIETAVFQQCSLAGVLIEQNSIVTPIKVDQSVVDQAFTTTLEVRVGVDQYAYDSHSVKVFSKYYDQYDHDAKNWGFYRIESVFCH